MYNLLITAKNGAWRSNVYEFERPRAVREYTDDHIQARFKAMTRENIEELMSYPCLFAYESGIQQKASLGWLTNIKPRGEEVRIEFELEKGLPQITGSRLEKLRTELDITNWELNRTHWAVKDVNLLQVLRTAGILSEAKTHGQGKESRLMRLGMTVPVTELHIRPSVFRVPAGKTEEDLVSVMMPFDAGFKQTHEAILTACKHNTMRCERADDIWDEPELIQDVFSLIYRSRFVICDFSGRNPNVFYEAGIAHTLGKTVIPIAQSKEDVPFDLGHLRYVKYLPNTEGYAELQRSLTKKLAKLIAG